MHLRFFTFILSGILCLSLPARAEEPASPPEEEEEAQTGATTGPDAAETSPGFLVQVFFVRLAKGEIEEAYDELLEGTRIAETPSDVLMLKKKTREALKLGGTLRGAELLEKKTSGTHLYMLSYLSLGSEYPLKWRFFFYKRPTGWKLIDIRISDRLAELFNEKIDPGTPAD